jgi:hypothetical protein
LLDPSELLDEPEWPDDVMPELDEELLDGLPLDDVDAPVLVVPLSLVVPGLPVVLDESSCAAYAVSAPVMMMLEAAKVAKCLRDLATRTARDVSGEFFMTRASPSSRQGHLSPTSNAGQMSL